MTMTMGHNTIVLLDSKIQTFFEIDTTYLMQALKKTTNLMGMAVAKAPHKSLTAVYNRLLDVLQLMPNNATYRIQTEKIVNSRLKMVEKTSNIVALENAIDCGQIEEVIIQANNEYELAKKMLKWKPWEPLISEAPPTQWKWPM